MQFTTVKKQTLKMVDFYKKDVEYFAQTSQILRAFEKHILPSWWVIFFLLMSFMAYEQSLKNLNQEYLILSGQVKSLHVEKTKALEIQEDFLLQINSQSDQDWVELTLMKGLGLVPEEHVKVFFNLPEES